MAARAHGHHVWRRRVHQVLDVGLAGDKLCQRIHWVLISVVLLNVLCVVLESVPAIDQAYHRLFVAIEVISVIIFVIEYVARLWAAVEQGLQRKEPPWRARLRHALSPGMLVDLFSILPFFIGFFVHVDLRILLLLRLLRFFKIARYSTGMRSLVDAVYAERNALAACGGILAGIILISASFMHLAEHVAQPDKFGTIPDAMYWAVVTVTTVGYGDVVPATPLGKVIAGVSAIAGLGMLALPVGILATAFSEVIHRRDFVVTWSMVARVPLFSGFDAETIAEIMGYLRSQTAKPGEIIVRKGERARSMYIVASGEVVVDLPRHRVVLTEGHFFGELALLESVKRSADVRAKVRTSLLVLEADDIQELMERRPDISQRIRDVADQRLNALRAAGGDIAKEELQA